MLQGTWYNELGSEMILQVNGVVVTGTYQTAVGNAQGIYGLYGATDSEPAVPTNQAVGFVVVWENGYGSSNSVTAWSGQWQMYDGQEIITTMWLLTSETDPSQDWKSTLVGKDVFTRNPPPQNQIEKNVRQSAWSHPTKFTAK
jgi:Avidin family